MKILVTGGAGYIGGTVAGLLTEKGHKAVVFDNLSHSRRDLLPAGVDFIKGELADRQALEDIFTAARVQNQPFDAVFHFAALIEAGESMVRPEIFFRNNTASTLSLLEAMLASRPKRLVFSSTAAVYGEPESVPIQEDARLGPTNPYGQSKLLVEQMLAWFNRIHGLRYASLRYFNVAGAPRGPGWHHPRRSARAGVPPDPAGPRRRARPPPLDPHLRRRLPHPRRHLHPRLHPRLRPGRRAPAGALPPSRMTRPRRRPPLIYNLGNGQGFSVRDVIESARRVTGHPIPAEIHPRRAGDPAVLVASSAKAIRELGWKPRYTAARRDRPHRLDLAPEALFLSLDRLRWTGKWTKKRAQENSPRPKLIVQIWLCSYFYRCICGILFVWSSSGTRLRQP